MAEIKVLLAGESWASLGLHLKGFATYTTGFYEEGGSPLITVLEAAGVSVTYIRNHEAQTSFPRTAQELRQYDVVLFSDIGSDTLLLHPDTLLRSQIRPNPLQAIKEYVEAGGGFCMIGGYMSFQGFAGHARYHKTPIEEILPVEMLTFDDRVEAPEGISPQVVAAAHPILKGVTPPWPVLLGYNRLRAKASGRMLLRYEQDPMLVVGEAGRGRTAAFASDCSPHWGTPEFTGWKHYRRFWHQLVAWLAKK